MVSFAGILAKQLMDYGKVLAMIELRGDNDREADTRRDEALRAMNLDASVAQDRTISDKSTDLNGEVSMSSGATTLANSSSYTEYSPTDTSVAFATAAGDIDVSEMGHTIVGGSSNDEDSNINIGVISQKYHDSK